MWQATDQVVLDWWKTASPIPTPASTTSTTKKSSRTAPTLFDRFPVQELVPSTDNTDATNPTKPPDSNDPPNSQGASSTGLSTGAQAGIGAGVGIAVIFLITLAYLIYRLRRAHSKIQHMEHQTGPHEVAYNPTGIEKSTRANVPEMATPANFHELPGIGGLAG